MQDLLDGFEVALDQLANDPNIGWPAWCEKQLNTASVVLVVFTETYRRRYDGEEPPGLGKGVAFEAKIIRQQLYDFQGINPKFRAIVFAEADKDFVPDLLAGNSIYFGLIDASYQKLIAWLRSSITAAASSQSAAIAWPQSVDDFLPQLADRKPAFDHFKKVLAGVAGERILLLQGPENIGKTALLEVFCAYCRQLQVPVCQVDLKGCPTIEDVLGTIQLEVGQDLLPNFCAAPEPNRTFKLLGDLKLLRKPLVLALDNYQASSDRIKNWVEGLLLPQLDHTPAVVAALCGHELPKVLKCSWGKMARLAELPPINRVDDWLEYIQLTFQYSELTHDHVEALVFALHGDPGQVSSALRSLAEKRQLGDSQ